MVYDDGFYELYRDYLKENRVRMAHSIPLRALGGSEAFERVLDLGCGRHCEFHVSTKQRACYVGIDRHAAPELFDFADDIIVGDYRPDNGDLAVRLAKEHRLTAAVSLFSAECTAPEAENRILYERLLSKTPIRKLLVSGFYYTHAADQFTGQEAGGLTSWQTITPIKDCASKVYTEVRMTLPCPSDLFGEDVIEVWRLLSRRYE